MPVTKDALCWLKRVSWLNSDLSLQLRQEIHAPPVSPGQALTSIVTVASTIQQQTCLQLHIYSLIIP